MARAASLLGREAIEQAPRVAVVRCNGAPEHRPRTNVYDGAPTCAIAHSLYTGEGGCPHGCLGEGDCVVVCNFDAIHMDPLTDLPVVVDEKCTACGACVEACPRDIIELRKKNKAVKTKEIRMGPHIREHDRDIKMNQGIKFLGKGHKVKFTIVFAGREITHVDLGWDIIKHVQASLVPEHGAMESAPTRDGKNIHMLVAPK